MRQVGPGNPLPGWYSAATVIVSIILAISVVFGIMWIITHTESWKDSGYRELTVLSCTGPTGGMIPIGVSKDIEIRPNYYYLLDGEGNWQSYRPGAFESCATLSVSEARKKGLIK